jgi:acetolactate synthase-1/2/3 large subunit
VKAWKVEDLEVLGRVLREAAEHEGPALVDAIAQSLEEAAAPVLQWMG